MTINFGTDPAAAPVDQTPPTDATEQQPTAPVSVPDPDSFLEIGGRKFTKEDVIKKITNADTFIETLKTERAQDRALLNEVQEALKQQVNIQEVLKQVSTPTPQTPTEAAPVVDPNAIVQQVLAQLQQQQTATQAEQNWKDVTSKLSTAYGDKVNEKVAAVAQENGLTLQEAAELGRSKPALFLKLFPETSAPAPKPTTNAFHKGSVTPAPAAPANPAGTGFGQARTTRESVSIYLNRLKELTG